MPIKLYTNPGHYNPSLRGFLHPLLKAFIGKGPEFTDKDRRVIYGVRTNDFCIGATAEQSDVAVLPMAWNYYMKKGKLELAYEFYDNARAHNLLVFSWNYGDYGVRIPNIEGMIVHRPSGYCSKLPQWHRGMPVFLNDPLKRYYNRDTIILRQKGNTPVVGFCGQAQGNTLKYTADVLRTSYRNVLFHIGQSNNEPQSIYPSTLLRSKVLKHFERDSRIQTNYIKRKKYRAGAVSKEERKRTTMEFFDNIVGSDYVVCVRGGGNFSVRLYETLAMGRIPIFVNTDCLLPLANDIKWKKHMVWVERDEIGQIASRVVDFHKTFTPAAFQDLQHQNRRLWEDRFSIGSFFMNAIQNEL